MIFHSLSIFERQALLLPLQSVSSLPRNRAGSLNAGFKPTKLYYLCQEHGFAISVVFGVACIACEITALAVHMRRVQSEIEALFTYRLHVRLICTVKQSSNTISYTKPFFQLQLTNMKTLKKSSILNSFDRCYGETMHCFSEQIGNLIIITGSRAVVVYRHQAHFVAASSPRSWVVVRISDIQGLHIRRMVRICET